MEQKIILSMLKVVGIHNPTSEDFQRVCEIVRVDKLPYKVKFGLYMLMPTLNQYVEYLMTPENTQSDE